MRRFAARFFASCLALCLASTCGDDQPAECTKPAECIAVGTSDCKVVAGHGRCVIACAVINGQDSCPSPYQCGGTADDGNTFCTAVK
jgi:hypothetical protein